MKTIAISQSNYIPWKGYFDLISQVDEFILYDDMQYTRRDWRNRNRIKTSQGIDWLTIPVDVKGKYFQTIKDTAVSESNWPKVHWRTIEHAYSKAPFFEKYRILFGALYSECETETSLSKINYKFITEICKLLNINTKISWSMDYKLVEGKTERLIDLCQQSSATRYVSGPAARDYIIPELFAQANIELNYMAYSAYPEYRQLYPPFEHAVSILDVIFNTGPEANTYIHRENIK